MRIAPTVTPTRRPIAAAVRSMPASMLAVLARRVDVGRLVGSGRRAAGPAVDLDAAAHDHRLQRPALGGGAEDRRRRVVGELAGRRRVGPAVRLPHRDVHDDVRVERGDRRRRCGRARSGAMRWNSARCSRRRGGSTSMPTSSPTHGSSSSSAATREPRSPPIPLTSTRRPAAMRQTLTGGVASPDAATLAASRRLSAAWAPCRITLRANGSSWRPARRSVTVIACGVVVDEAGPADVAAHDPDDAVADLLAVDDHLDAGLEQLVELAVERPQPRLEVVGVERPVPGR